MPIRFCNRSGTLLGESVAQNQVSLRQYSWTQKIQISLKSDVKSTKIESCPSGVPSTHLKIRRCIYGTEVADVDIKE